MPYPDPQNRGSLPSACPSGHVAAVSATLGALLCLTSPAAAQATEDSERNHDKEKEEQASEQADYTVETTAPATESAQDARLPSGWMTRLELKDAFGRGRDLADALERVAGVSVQRRSGLGQPAYASVRGGNPRQMQVLLNGVDIGAPAGTGFDLGTLSTGWVDGVEVYRGSAGAVHGSGALTGAMNLQMTPPEGDGWSAEATAMGGSFGTIGGSAGFANAGGEADSALELNASWRRGAGNFRFVDEQGQTHRRVNNHHRRLSVSGSARAALGTSVSAAGHSAKSADTHGVDAAFLYESSRRGTPGPSEYQDSYRRAHTDSERMAMTGAWHRRGVASGGWGALDMEAKLGLSRRGLRYANPEPFLQGDAFHSESVHTMVDGRLEATGYFDFGHIAHLSLEARHDGYRQDLRNTEDGRLRADRQSLAAGLTDEWLLFDQKLSLIGGLRAEFIEGRRDYLPLIPSAGLIWRATPWMKLKSNLSRTFRAPDFDELYLRTESVRGNPDLQPERALEVDAGVAVNQPGPASGDREAWPVGGEVTFFYSDIERSILFLPRTAYLFEATNIEGARAMGVESSVNLDLNRWLRVRGTYTFTDARADALPGVQLPHRPRHRGHLRAEAELARLGITDQWEKLRSLTLNADARARSRVNLDNFGNLHNRSYWQVDLGLSVRPRAWLEASVQMRNVTNNRWGADSLHRPLPGRAVFTSLTLRDGTL